MPTTTHHPDDIEVAETDKIDINRPSLYVWTEKIEKILDKMRINCVNLSEYHIYKYSQKCKPPIIVQMNLKNIQ